MSRFFIAADSPTTERMQLDERESHHASSVLRLAAGDPVELLDGRGRVLGARIEGYERGRLCVRVLSERRAPRPIPVEMTLAAAVIRPERMDLLTEKATELGAAVIAPVIAERCNVRLSRDRWTAKTGRWRKIVRESCKQCGQPYEPQVRETRAFEVFLEELPDGEALLIPTLDVPGRIPAGRALDEIRALGKRSLTWLIGPEGDFTPHEIEAAVRRGGRPVDLGPLVLRSETAAWYALSVTHHHLREGSDAQPNAR